MNRNIIISSVLHTLFIFITAMSLPFLAKNSRYSTNSLSRANSDCRKINVPFAPKAKKIIEEKKKEETCFRTAPQKSRKTKAKTVLSPDQKNKK